MWGKHVGTSVYYLEQLFSFENCFVFIICIFICICSQSCINMKRKISTKWKNCILLCKWNVSEALGDLLAVISGMPLKLFSPYMFVISPQKWTALTPVKYDLPCRKDFVCMFHWAKKEQFLTCCSYWGAHFRQQITEFLFTLKQFFSLVFLCCCCCCFSEISETALIQL